MTNEDVRRQKIRRAAKARGFGTKVGKKREDMTQYSYPYLTVLEAVGKRRHPDGKPRGSYYWRCLCICGKEVLKDSYTLKHNPNTSCGCQIPIGLPVNFSKARITFGLHRRDKNCSNCKHLILYQGSWVCRRFLINKLRCPVDLKSDGVRWVCSGYDRNKLVENESFKTSELSCTIEKITPETVELKLTFPNGQVKFQSVEIDYTWQGDVDLSDSR